MVALFVLVASNDAMSEEPGATSPFQFKAVLQLLSTPPPSQYITAAFTGVLHKKTAKNTAIKIETRIIAIVFLCIVLVIVLVITNTLFFSYTGLVLVALVVVAVLVGVTGGVEVADVVVAVVVGGVEVAVLTGGVVDEGVVLVALVVVAVLVVVTGGVEVAVAGVDEGVVLVALVVVAVVTGGVEVAGDDAGGAEVFTPANAGFPASNTMTLRVVVPVLPTESVTTYFIKCSPNASV